MQVCYSSDDLASCLERAAEVSEAHPVVVSAFMQRCKELECDAVADNGKVLACAISEHIEFAGVHSGDATIQFPGQRIYGSVLSRIRRTAAAIASELHITGPFNIQFLSSDLDLKVIECNLRASRSFPFVSKVWRVNLIDLATQCMLGQHPAPVQGNPFDLGYVGVKCSQFSFARLHQADPVSGVDMASTGEVGCLGRTADEALLKAMLSVGHHVPAGPVLLSTGDPFQKADMLPACRLLAQKGYTLYATGGTCRYLQANGVPALPVRWPDQPDDGTPSAEDLIREHKVDLVVNNPKNFSHKELGNGYHLRRAAVDFNVPLITDARLAAAYIRAFCTIPEDSLEIF
jgi:carbamoyl-phosphate synthase large subunit